MFVALVIACFIPSTTVTGYIALCLIERFISS